MHAYIILCFFSELFLPLICCQCTAAAFELANYVIFMTLDPSATPARLEATSFPSEFLRL